ncbi:MAG: DNA helicase RecQ [bacterium]
MIHYAKTILKNTFGYDSFRPLQQEVIHNIINKKDTLVIMPTGGGKSICYQIPALIFEGLTIVISPLISLMKDQVEQLRQLGIKTALLNSSLPPDVYKDNFQSVKNKVAKLLYLAPESLFKDEITNLLNSVQLDCITVDEAHCISEWGHDFRPEYRQLGILRQKYPSAVCIGLTATATPRVQDDIIKNLNMNKATKFIASFNRENLFLQVIPKHDAFEQTVKFLKEHSNQSGIIYCFSRKQVDELSEDLSNLGFSTKPYHAGLSDEERNANQDLFIKDKVQFIVATIAFGMGINKSNVRFVLHYDLPKNLESYYQEIGRSGRDGLRADCLLLFSYSDIAKINYFINQKEDPVEIRSAKAHLSAMVKYAESEFCRRYPMINYFGEKYNTDNCGMCDNCLADEKELIDITVQAQKFLSAAKRTGEIYGANYLIDVLMGSESEKILSNRHHNLTVYGIGKEYNKKQWHLLAEQFIKKELLRRDDEFGSLKLTEKSLHVLFKSEKVFGAIKEPEVVSKKIKMKEQLQDNELFELLRMKRREIADEYNIPPYVIFSDKSLIQMATLLPQTKSDFLKISGVGSAKLERYGNVFINIIKKYCTGKSINILPQKAKQGGKKSSSGKLRHIEVSEAYNAGSSIDQLSIDYNVKSATIINHIFRYVQEGNAVRLDGLFEKISIPTELQAQVFDEFSKTESLALSGIHEKFNGEISYEDLHLLRLAYYLKTSGNYLQQ